jgi:hypothetical protein
MRNVLKDFRDTYGNVYAIADAATHDTLTCYREANADLMCISTCTAFDIENGYVTCWGRKIGKLLKDELRKCAENSSPVKTVKK